MSKFYTNWLPSGTQISNYNTIKLLFINKQTSKLFQSNNMFFTSCSALYTNICIHNINWNFVRRCWASSNCSNLPLSIDMIFRRFCLLTGLLFSSVNFCLNVQYFSKCTNCSSETGQPKDKLDTNCSPYVCSDPIYKLLCRN